MLPAKFSQRQRYAGSSLSHRETTGVNEMHTIYFTSARPDGTVGLAAEAEGVLKISVRPGHGESCRRDVQRVYTQVLHVYVCVCVWCVCRRLHVGLCVTFPAQVP